MRVGNMLADQSAICERLAKLGRLPIGGEAQIKEFTLQLIVEATEVLAEVNWKHHRAASKIVHRQNIINEVVDCLKFCLNMAVAVEASEDELYKAWVDKTALVEQRLDTETDPWQVAAEKERAARLKLQEQLTACEAALNDLRMERDEIITDHTAALRNLEVLSKELEALR